MIKTLALITATPEEMKPLFPFHEKEYTLSDLINITLKINFSLYQAFGVSRNIYTEISRAREAIMLVLKK